MNTSVSFVSGAIQKTGWVRVGSNSSFTNEDAVFSFIVTPSGENIASINEIRLSFNWNNDTAGSGWRGKFAYAARIRQGSATGNVLATVTTELEGVSGTWNVQAGGLNLAAGTTYYVTLNVSGSRLSSMKAFSTTATAQVISWTNGIGKCVAPTDSRINGNTGWTYCKPGDSATLQIMGGGGVPNNLITGFRIEELVYVRGQGEVTGWRKATNANEQADAAVYAPTSRSVKIYPTKTRGQNKRFRIKIVGQAGEAYASDWYETTTNLVTNRVPNICTNVRADKSLVAPGSILRIYFSGGGDPDGNIWMYQIKAEDESGNAYSGEELGRQYDTTKNYVDIDLSLGGNAFVAGTKWRFMVRGHDKIEACAWSAPSQWVEIGGAVRIKVGEQWKQAMPYVRKNGQWKQAVPYAKHEGAWKASG
ncbi:hypothetical protein AALG83_03925 [Christensenellaceae bacterium 44-20]